MPQTQDKPTRKCLPHDIPSWVTTGSCYFITLCTTPRGTNQLALPDIAQAIHESFWFNMNRGIWWIDLLLLMPDHLHALIRFPVEPGIHKCMADWKHFISRRTGIQWQRDFFEHRLRDDENHIEKAHYIRMNPVRGGLISHQQDWPFVWTFDDP